MSMMTPREITSELDKHIVGQNDAKRAVAIALRNRWRRLRLDEEMRHEITPKNILMIGPTGVGKTEIARRLARLAKAPFIKVEATKFTEVGYVGRDVESIIRDLVDEAIKMLREAEIQKVQNLAMARAEERILDVLLPRAREQEGEARDSGARQLYRKKLREGELDDREIELQLAEQPAGIEIMAPPGLEDMTSQLKTMFSSMNSGRKKLRRMPVSTALRAVTEEEQAKLIDEEDIRGQAVEVTEQTGIVFLDEIDKVTNQHELTGASVSREGVQRDLLPLIEGSTVKTKYGMVRTDHVLFIASGAFHFSKPSDLIPELQGRLPIRVELGALSVEDFERILIEPDASLTEQYQALLHTDGLQLKFAADGIRKIAEIAWRVNERTENIGARRLHTVMERLLEEVSFGAPDMAIGNNGELVIDSAYVEKQLADLAQDEDLARYIL